MKNGVIRFVLVVFTLSLLISAAQAAGPWEVLARSPGAIESAALSSAGDVCVLEQLRFTRIASGTADVQQRDLPLSERIFLSPSGSVYASITYEGEQDMANAAILTLYGSNGQALWSLAHHPLNDVYPLESGGAITVSRNINLPKNDVYFFSPQGRLLQRLALPAVGEIKVSPSSDRILINSGVDGAILCDAAGNELARLGPTYRMFISNDGGWVAILYGPKMTLFHQGRATYTGELGGEIVRGIAFAPDNALLAAFTDHAFFLMKNPGGDVLLQRQLDAQGDLSFTSVDLTRDATCIAVGVERDLGESIKGPERHPEGEIRLYNRDGGICYQVGVTYSRWNTTTPRVKFSEDGSQLLVLTRDEVMRAPLASLCGKGGER